MVLASSLQLRLGCFELRFAGVQPLSQGLYLALQGLLVLRVL